MSIRDKIQRLKKIASATTAGAIGAFAEAALSTAELEYFDNMIADSFRRPFPQTVEAACKPDSLCLDCDRYGLGYMLKDEIWSHAMGENEVRYLCLWCVEKRLRRPVQLDDINDAPVNAPIHYFREQVRDG